MVINQKQLKRKMRANRVRAKIKGTAKRPRMSVFRSNKHIYVQLIDDEKGRTLLALASKKIKKQKNKKKERSGKVAVALETGKLLAQKALKLNIKEVVFDRGGYKFHGRVKAVAEGAREGGLKF